LRSYQYASLSGNYQNLMEPEGLLLYSQPPATGPYREPEESNRHPQSHFNKINFNITFPFTPVSQLLSSIQASQLKLRTLFSCPFIPFCVIYLLALRRCAPGLVCPITQQKRMANTQAVTARETLTNCGAGLRGMNSLQQSCARQPQHNHNSYTHSRGTTATS
jgi:hypothetical protein